VSLRSGIWGDVRRNFGCVGVGVSGWNILSPVKPNRRSFAFQVYRWVAAYGLDLHKTWKAVRFTPAFLTGFFRYRRLAKTAPAGWPLGLNHPQLADWGESGGSTSGHYFHQDLYVARRVHENSPRRHIDVGSRVDGFVAHVAAFREIEVIDIRPNVSSVHRIKFSQCDLMAPPAHMQNLCDSLSCLHALEHFGLGRYGDPLNPDGYRAGFSGLTRLLAPNGLLYFSVPIGTQRIEFNAHRVFSVQTVLELAAPSFSLERFAFVNDAGEFREVPIEEMISATRNLYYGCGIFEFRKNRVGPREEQSPSAPPPR
jgi:hypothetical protein